MRVGDTLLPASVEIALSPTRSPRRRSLAGSPLVAPRASLPFRPCYTDIDLAECPTHIDREGMSHQERGAGLRHAPPGGERMPRSS